MKNVFSSYHPIVNICFFIQVFLFSMFIMHPAGLIISFCGAFAYSIYLNGKKALRFNLIFVLPMLVITALINPVFNHEGATILAYLPSGNPLTLESIAYGGAAALMLASVVCWFSCYNAVMTTDKIVYLFGRAVPALSLILSMSLRLVPRYIAQIKIIADAQKCIGRDASAGNPLSRVRRGIRIVSILVTWAFENAIETADSMKSRGYGLPGRTAFSIFRFDRRDRAALSFLIMCGIYIGFGLFSGGVYYRYFPAVSGRGGALFTIGIFAAYAALCFTPMVLSVYEEIKWTVIRSKI